MNEINPYRKMQVFHPLKVVSNGDTFVEALKGVKFMYLDGFFIEKDTRLDYEKSMWTASGGKL